MKVKIEFSGGIELMFDNKKNLEVELQGEKPTLQDLIEELRTNHLKDKEEMFIQKGTVRPGIIVLINDTDWELMDTVDYKVCDNDSFAFISTLHGG